jgi:mannonate dehydratase
MVFPSLLDRAVGLPPERMVNGSDYPAIVPHVFLEDTLDGLVKRGWLTERQADLLDELYLYNPLLFDFVMKRTLEKGGKRIPREFFFPL